MFDRLLAIIDVVLLTWIVVQGEAIRFYGRGVYRMQKERDNERRQWREAKRRQQERREPKNPENRSTPSMVEEPHQPRENEKTA